jgi:hypothetical protein
METNGEYGYQLPINDGGKKQGIASKAVVVVRYLGQKDGVYAIEMSGDAGEVFRLECKEPCESVEVKLVLGGKVIKAETMSNTSGSLMNAVFEDALGGQLKPYGKAPQ